MRQRSRSCRSGRWKWLHAIVSHWRAVSLILVLAMPVLAPAQTVDLGKRRGSFSPGELSLLPAFCSDTQGSAGYEGEPGDRWRALMGDAFKHMHHYCRGLRDVNYARMLAGLTSQQRSFLWERSVGEFLYIVSNSPTDLVLLPEVYVRIGESTLELGRLSEAQAAFEQARRLKPQYWPAYTIWADHLVAMKQQQAARGVLEEGLRHAPSSEEIKRRLAQLTPERADLARGQ